MRGIRSTRRSAVLAALAALLAALGIAACGSSQSSGTAADPATVVPASAPLYLAAVVQPEGMLKKHATADAKALTHSREPFASLLGTLQGSQLLGHFDYAREVKPWLGPNAGLFVTSTAALTHAGEALSGELSKGLSLQSLLHSLTGNLSSAGGLQGALVLDTSNLSGARSFLAKLAHGEGAHEARYKGIAYQVDSAGIAEAIVGRFAVIGSVSALQRVIDTHAGGPSLAKGSAPYRQLAGRAVANTLLSVYLDSSAGAPAGASAGASASASAGASARSGTSGGAAAGASAGASASASTQSLLSLLPGAPQQLRLSLVPGSGSLSLYADMLSSSSGEAEVSRANAAAAQMVEHVPAASWLAAGVGESGSHVGSDLSALRTVATVAGSTVLSRFGGEALTRLAGNLYAHRAALRTAFSGWAGPAAAFASGASLFNLQAGLIVKSSAPARSRAAVSELGTVLSSAGATVKPVSIPGAEVAIGARLPNFPPEIDAGAGEGLFAVGLGPASIEGALHPEGSFSSSPLYRAAEGALNGAKPLAVVEFSAIVGLIEGLGLQESASVAPAMPFLRALGTLAAGAQPLGGGITRLHAVLSLQQSG